MRWRVFFDSHMMRRGRCRLTDWLTDWLRKSAPVVVQSLHLHQQTRHTPNTHAKKKREREERELTVPLGTLPPLTSPIPLQSLIGPRVCLSFLVFQVFRLRSSFHFNLTFFVFSLSLFLSCSHAISFYLYCISTIYIYVQPAHAHVFYLIYTAIPFRVARSSNGSDLLGSLSPFSHDFSGYPLFLS